ncbi:putative receptor-like protein kinase At1g49730 [Wolffia australiana]
MLKKRPRTRRNLSAFQSGSAAPLAMAAFLFTLLALPRLASSLNDCPLDLGWSDLTSAAYACSDETQRGNCCRYLNAFVAISVSHYASSTGELGVPAAFIESCLGSVSETLQEHGISPLAMDSCGLGTKIMVNSQCEGRSTVLEMLQSPGFSDVVRSCEPSVSLEGGCRRCLSSSMIYIHRLVGSEDNVTLSTCRGAAFVALANQGKNLSAVDLVSCFFGIPASSLHADPLLQSPSSSDSLNPQSDRGRPEEEPTRDHHPYHLSVIHVIGIAVAGTATLLLAFLILLIRRKRKELDVDEESLPPPPHNKFPEGPRSAFKRFSYKETKRATNNFESVIGEGGFGTVYRAEFGDGIRVAVKRMNKLSEQGENEFCCEIELLGRLHHRHLVALRGYCIKKQERFLMYEYMENGSLKDHIHSSQKPPLSWQTRIQIAVDVANALEYLHFYCNPPLCHRDVKSSNILLDENFVAKLADFGLAHASRSGSIFFEPVNTDIRGTPGYLDPEYAITQELTEKSDVYSYGVVLLELVTGRRAIQDKKNLVTWSQKFIADESTLPSLVDPAIRGTMDLEQLHVVVWIIQWCTRKEAKTRPSIRQVLRSLDEHIGLPFHGKEKEGEVSYLPKEQQMEGISTDANLLSSSSTSRSYCSRSFLLDGGSPSSPAAHTTPTAFPESRKR